MGELGRITSIEKTDDAYRIELEPRCRMPGRTAVPRWLKDRRLEIVRRAADEREIGGPGDSIVLTPQESARWLHPLTACPWIARGKVPETVRLELRWWHTEEPPAFTVRAAGRLITGRFTKRDGVWGAAFRPADLLEGEPTLPIGFEVTVGDLTITAAVLPESSPCFHRLIRGPEKLWYLQSPW